MKKLLIVDDEEKIRSLIASYSHYEGYLSCECTNGKECIDFLKSNSVDLVLLDVMMPVMDGFSALREIRAFSDTPVIMLTAKGDESDKIQGFTEGADDYLCKPFSPRELMLRINAVLKRSTKSSVTTYEVNGLKIDCASRKVFAQDRQITLSNKEYELLVYLVENEGVALTRDMILSNVWTDFEGYDRTIDAHIKSLRKSLGEYASYIKTLRGVGYRFERE